MSERGTSFTHYMLIYWSLGVNKCSLGLEVNEVSVLMKLMFQLEEMNDETRKDHVATKGRDLNGKKESSVPRSGEHSREQKRKVPREMGSLVCGRRGQCCQTVEAQ